MSTDKADQEELVFDQLGGEQCTFCEDGTLVNGTYKDDSAILCESCGTPAYRSI